MTDEAPAAGPVPRPERKRLFFALWPDRNCRQSLHGIQQRLVRGGKPVATGNLHLTLHFMGALDEEQQAAARAAADEVRGEPFQITLDRVGTWRNGIHWLALSRPPRELIALHDGLFKSLEARGFSCEPRAFLPHVTLARKAPRHPAMDIEPLCWNVDRYALIESRTLPSGAEYRVLREWPLG